MKLSNIINELFDESQIYDYTLFKNEEYENGKMYNYEFRTNNNMIYTVYLEIKTQNREGKIDFLSYDPETESTEIISLVNKGGAIKIFNTIWDIIQKHIPEMDKLLLSSTMDRTKFYEKLLNHKQINYKRLGANALLIEF